MQFHIELVWLYQTQPRKSNSFWNKKEIYKRKVAKKEEGNREY